MDFCLGKKDIFGNRIMLNQSPSMVVQLPDPFASIPRYPLLLGPSPIHLLHRITDDLGGRVQVYAKRDDLVSGHAHGGSKIRKLEYLIADALASDCDTLISVGAVQSNHTRQVAAVAARLGLRARLVQEHWVDKLDPVYENIGNAHISKMMGAKVHIELRADSGVQRKDSLRVLLEECKKHGERPYFIPAGASDHPLGGLGFARWAFEVREQEKELGVMFDTIVACAATGSTMAGIVAGFKLLEKIYPEEKRRRLIGVDASAKPVETRAQILRIAKDTAAQIGLTEDDITEEDVVLDERYHAGAYGIPDMRTWDAIGYGARMEGIIMDPVYSGKSFAGLLDMIRNDEISGGNVLYAFLGGQLALNAYSQLRHIGP